MHERSVVTALLRQVKSVASEHPEGRVAAVRLRVGEFAGVEPALLASAFDELAAEDLSYLPALVITMARLEGECQQCGRRSPIERFRFECDGCGSGKLKLLGGEELLLESITLEEQP